MAQQKYVEDYYYLMLYFNKIFSFCGQLHHLGFKEKFRGGRRRDPKGKVIFKE
jgi:hypothetical protein